MCEMMCPYQRLHESVDAVSEAGGDVALVAASLLLCRFALGGGAATGKVLSPSRNSGIEL